MASSRKTAARSGKKRPPALKTPKEIEDLIEDDKNRRMHTDRGDAMILEALKTIGPARSIVINGRSKLLAGHGVKRQARAAGVKKIKVVDGDRETLVVVRRSDLTPEEERLLAMYDNRAGELSQWNVAQLQADNVAGLNLAPFFSVSELADIFGILTGGKKRGLTDPEAIPDGRKTNIQPGDLFELGGHRLLCGDTTDPAAVARLVGDLGPVALISADPPYGMGKEKDGILNDNLYESKLDAFQLQWWNAWATVHAENGSAYIWGTAPDLWRLWWSGGLKAAGAGALMVRNEIVWNKGAGFGMNSELHHQYPTATERALFLMRGQQFLGNQNVADYWEGYEPLRQWLEAERVRAGWSNTDVNKMTKTHMAGHWFTKSQFAPISRKHYDILAKNANGKAFATPYDEVFAQLFPTVRAGGNANRRDLAEQMREARTYFDNTHDKMTDVWEFPRVLGEERFGHATPKPVAMIERCIKSSADVAAVVAAPFAGTGPEFIAGEANGRRVVGMELKPEYCQIIIDRWEAFTGKKARRVAEPAGKRRKTARKVAKPPSPPATEPEAAQAGA